MLRKTKMLKGANTKKNKLAFLIVVVATLFTLS
jgi:hypothetical protein